MGDHAPWTTAPLSFRLATFLNRHRIRGGYRLLDTAAALGWLDGLMRYELGNGVSILVPLARPENRASIRVMEKAGLGFEKFVDFAGMRAVYHALDRPAPPR